VKQLQKAIHIGWRESVATIDLKCDAVAAESVEKEVLRFLSQ